MYEQSLIQAGLYLEQAQIYELLLKNGPLPAGKISKKTSITRSLVYKILDDLMSMNLVEKQDEPKKVAIFKPLHPYKLQELAEKKEKQAKNAQMVLAETLPYLVSEFQLLQEKPDIRFYEGEEGIKRVVFDSLTAKDGIYSYIDNEAVNKYFPKINTEYVKKRIELGIKKKMITIDGNFIRSRASQYDPNFTEIRLIDGNQYPFYTVMQIYNNKVSYITLDAKKMIGIIIEDRHIASMHKGIFEFNWSKALILV
jgi:sugar-specific transcriptional regulator TrmB